MTTIRAGIADSSRQSAQFAARKHIGQTRRDKTTPYVVHLARVAARVAKYGSDYEDAAWLHDTIEDTDTTARELMAAGFSRATVEAVVLLTKLKTSGTPFSISYYLEKIRDNDIARRVKIADMIDNLADSPTDEQFHRYIRGISYLAGHSNQPE